MMALVQSLKEFNKLSAIPFGISSNSIEQHSEFAKNHNLSLTHLSLAFVNVQPFVTSNIIGATTMEQLKENIESVDINLNDEIIEQINQVHENQPNPAP